VSVLCTVASCLIGLFALGRGVPTVDVVLLAVACSGVAGLSAYALGWDMARDLDLLVDRVRSLAGNNETPPAPVPIVSADEIGDLEAALARLHDRLTDDEDSQRRALRLTEVADREKNAFLTDVEQAIRRPLLAIQSTGNELAEGGRGALSPAQSEDVNIIVKGAEQLLALIEDVVDIAVAQSGSVQLRLESLDAGAMVREVVRAHQPQLPGRDVTLRADVSSDLPPLRADSRRLRQVLNNLVGNALKFTEKGEIVVSVRADSEEWVSIDVVDTGPGIPNSDLSKIFEEFGQAGTARTRRRGAGLGLAICRRLVELHGGTLTVASKVGRGSQFTVRFPRATT